MANTIKLGSLYLDDHPVEIGAEYVPGQSIKVGETVPGKESFWVVVNGMLIADRCILTNVSWNDLNANDLVFGKEVTIEGYRYKARLLKVGSEEGDPNEWDAALDTVGGEDNELWHWNTTLFWGQEQPASLSASLRVYRGFNSARHFYWLSFDYRDARLGFRPALVPLTTEQPAPALLGHPLKLWGGQNIVWGCLEDVTDYDIVLSNWFVLSDWSRTQSAETGFSSQLPNGYLVVNRNAISAVQKS